MREVETQCVTDFARESGRRGLCFRGNLNVRVRFDVRCVSVMIVICSLLRERENRERRDRWRERGERQMERQMERERRETDGEREERDRERRETDGEREERDRERREREVKSTHPFFTSTNLSTSTSSLVTSKTTTPPNRKQDHAHLDKLRHSLRDQSLQDLIQNLWRSTHTEDTPLTNIQEVYVFRYSLEKFLVICRETLPRLFR